MPDDINGAREVVQECRAIAEYHLAPDWIPVCVLELFSKMNRAHNAHISVIDARPAELVLIELENKANVVVGLLGHRICSWHLHPRPWEVVLVWVILGVVDLDAELLGRDDCCVCSSALLYLLLLGQSLLILLNHALGVLQGLRGLLLGLLVDSLRFGNVLEKIFRHYGRLLLASGRWVASGRFARGARPAQGLKAIASLRCEVFAVLQRTPGPIARFLVDVSALALNDSFEQIGRYNWADMRRLVGVPGVSADHRHRRCSVLPDQRDCECSRRSATKRSQKSRGHGYEIYAVFR